MAAPSLAAAPPLLDDGDAAQLSGVKESTRAARYASVEAAIGVMRARLAEPLALQDLARAALLSRYHFNRVFRLITGVPPGRFLTALRMVRARQMLLTEDVRVTDVCYSVGFDSLGTFTTRFGQLVGVAPMQLRSLAEAYGPVRMADLVTVPERLPGPASGQLRTRDDRPCVAVVGLFAGAVPQGLPVACCVAAAPGPVWLGPAPRGRYHVLALGFPGAETVLEAMLIDEPLVCGLTGGVVGGTYPTHVGELVLRPPQAVEPPVVLAAPVLSAAGAAARRREASAMARP